MIALRPAALSLRFFGAALAAVLPAQRPPHRSVRAELLHTAPTSDTWRRSAGSDADAGSSHSESIDRLTARTAPKSSGLAGFADGEPAQLTSLGGPLAGSPRWSPDSRWIAFDAPKSGNTHIFVISSDGGPPRLLTQGAANNVRPSWSNDGKWIYFGSNRSGDWQIWKAPAQGGDAVQVTKGGGRQAVESPDGKLLYYSKYQKPGIWSVPVEGGEESPVLEKARQSIWALPKDGISFFHLNAPLPPLIQFSRFL